MAIIYSIIVIFSIIKFFRLPLIKNIIQLRKFKPEKYNPREWIRLVDLENYTKDNITCEEVSIMTDIFMFPASQISVKHYMRNILKCSNLVYRKEKPQDFFFYYSHFYKNTAVCALADLEIDVFIKLTNIINSNNPSKERVMKAIMESKSCHTIMKKKKLGVYCFSYLEIERLYKKGRLEIINNYNAIINDNIAIISIVNRPRDKNGETDWTTIHPIPDGDRKYQVLNLQFQDDSEDFSIEDATKIIEFILYNKKLGRDFYVHCIMGKSRSQAVCRFILDTFPEDYEYKRELENPLRTPNYHILSTLKLVWRDLYEDFTTSV